MANRRKCSVCASFLVLMTGEEVRMAPHLGHSLLPATITEALDIVAKTTICPNTSQVFLVSVNYFTAPDGFPHWLRLQSHAIANKKEQIGKRQHHKHLFTAPILSFQP